MTNEEKINLIGQKILLLSNNLDKYKIELQSLQQQLELLKTQQQHKTVIVEPVEHSNIQKTNTVQPTATEPVIVEDLTETPPPVNNIVPPQKEVSGGFEEFIGSKLISIIGIFVLIIGIGLGVKYAIDNDLLGPVARIMLAYTAGAVMLGFAFKLKSNYKAFSAVLLSGAMASWYFTSFVAYSYYNLFPQLVAFAIMLVLTATTVYAATLYALEIIGIIGLVGAYAVPLLLSDGTGKIEHMLTYTAIINCGILVLCFKKLWKVMYYFAFVFTWLIVITWFAIKYNYDVHFTTVLTFSSIFFIQFYINNLAYKIVKKEQFNIEDSIGVILNSIIYFLIGYAASNNIVYEQYSGLFSFVNAAIHFLFAAIIFLYNKRTAEIKVDNKLIYLLTSIGIAFIYTAFHSEITVYYDTRYAQSLIKVPSTVTWAEPGAIEEIQDYSWVALRDVVLIIYNLLFFSIITIIARFRLHNTVIRWGLFAINIFLILTFIVGLDEIRELRNLYLNEDHARYFHSSSILVYIRYISFALFGVLLYSTHLLLKNNPFPQFVSKIYSGALIHFFILIVLSVELIHLNILANYHTAAMYYVASGATYKVGLTTLWGIYSFVLIVYGIFKKRQTVRITAISFMGITLLKLLIFDTWTLSTGYKIIAYILLGIILLVVAFLYQKFKKTIFGVDEAQSAIE